MSLEEDITEVDPEVDEYCSEVCYDIAMEHDGFCKGEDCIDWDCYSECIKSFYGGGG